MAGFARNVSRSSASTIASAERHRHWIQLRREGLRESEIAAKYGVSQQAVSKAVLKYVRDVPKREAERLRQAHFMQIVHMNELAMRAYDYANYHKCLHALNVAVRLLERQAKLLGLDRADCPDAEQQGRDTPSSSALDFVAQL